MRYNLGAHSDIGNGRRLQEDYMMFREYGKDILAVIADGTGTTDNRIQPAVMAVTSIINEISEVKEQNDSLFQQDPQFFLERAMMNANNVIGTLKLADEETYNGYAASVSAVYLTESGMIYCSHAGNTRVYILRNSGLLQLTEDHTVAAEQVNNGELDIGHYYFSPNRLRMTNGIGLMAKPKLYQQTGRVKENDLILLTTDGVHYAFMGEDNAIVQIILNSTDIVDASEKLVMAAKEVERFSDNMAAMLIGVSS